MPLPGSRNIHPKWQPLALPYQSLKFSSWTRIFAFLMHHQKAHWPLPKQTAPRLNQTSSSSSETARCLGSNTDSSSCGRSGAPTLSWYCTVENSGDGADVESSSGLCWHLGDLWTQKMRPRDSTCPIPGQTGSWIGAWTDPGLIPEPEQFPLYYRNQNSSGRSIHPLTHIY